MILDKFQTKFSELGSDVNLQGLFKVFYLKYVWTPRYETTILSEFQHYYGNILIPYFFNFSKDKVQHTSWIEKRNEFIMNTFFSIGDERRIFGKIHYDDIIDFLKFVQQIDILSKDNIEYLYSDIDILNNLFLTIITILVGFIIKWQVVDFQIDLIFRIAILIYILVTINIAFSIKKYTNILKNTPRFQSLIRNNVFSYIIVTAIFFILPFVLYKSIFGGYIKIDLVELLISQLTAFIVGVTIYNPKSNIFLQTFVAFIPIFLILVLEQFTRINISNTVIDLSKSIIILFSIVAIVKKLFFK